MRLYKPPARWLREIEKSNHINPSEVYSITDIARLVSRHRATVSSTLDVWISHLMGELSEYRKYAFTNVNNKSRVCREIRGDFLIELSKKCNDFTYENRVNSR